MNTTSQPTDAIMTQLRDELAETFAKAYSAPVDQSSVPQNRGYTLEELLEGITPENSHEATDWGEPVGNEVW